MLDSARIGVHGGGRWARVLASVTKGLLTPQDSLWVFSDSNNDGWTNWATEQNIGGPSIHVCASRDTLLGPDGPTDILIARKAGDHAESTLTALSAGKRALVEKPFATNIPDAETVVDTANRLGPNAMMAGHVFRYASNLARFGDALRNLPGRRAIDLVWTDPSAETRHGEAKNHDATLGIAWDIVPHVWSILGHVVDVSGLVLHDARPASSGNGIAVQLSGHDCAIRFEAIRDSDRRRRLMRVNGPAWEAEIDFATEPGTAGLDGRTIDVSHGFFSPLARQVSAFLSRDESRMDPLSSPARSIEALILADQISDRTSRE